jgi:aquaporin Z
MSMNPARTFGSAIFAGVWTGWWIYLTAPTLAMLAAAELYVRRRGFKKVLCAKLDHSGQARCIFNCRFAEIAVNESDANDVARSPLNFRPVKGLF